MVGLKTATSDYGDGSQGTTSESSGDNSREDTSGNDSIGDTASSSSSSGDAGDSAGQAGDTGEVDTYEGVSSDDFQVFTESMANFQAAMLASQAVITFAIFFCLGVLAVQTFIRSLERV